MRTALLLCLGLAALPVSAEILRWTDASGRVHYGDRVPAPASGVEPRPDLAAPPVVASAGFSPGALDAEAIEAVRERARERHAALEAAHAAVAAAEAELRAASERRARGVEPLPGERLGMAGGGARLSQPYFERQARLESALHEARARLEQALARRNELR